MCALCVIAPSCSCPYASQAPCVNCGIMITPPSNRTGRCNSCRHNAEKGSEIDDDELPPRLVAVPDSVPLASAVISLSSPRKRKEFIELRPSEKNKRKQVAVAVLEKLKTPLKELQQQPVEPAQLLHLSTTERNKVRAVEPRGTIPIRSEKRMIDFKKQLATDYSTATATFSFNNYVCAYVCDPIGLVSHLARQSPFICIGGDRGGDTTKLGVTYRNTANTLEFIALVVSDCQDNYDDLLQLKQQHMQFIGQSAGHNNIFTIFQLYLDNTARPAFLNGDWPFICALLALKGHTALYPCPICIIAKDHLMETADHRKQFPPAGKGYGLKPDCDPLITIPHRDRIVPTPLHVFLGICNRLLTDVLHQLVGNSVDSERVTGKFATIHSTGCGGLADMHSLNGPELSRFIKNNGVADMLAAAARNGRQLTAAQQGQAEVLQLWMKSLHDELLPDKQFSETEVENLRVFVESIHQHWLAFTGILPFPKLHMLHHIVEFVTKHKFIGRVSEARMESYHAQFNELYNKRHRNSSHNKPERLRRCLADSVLSAIQPVLQRNKENEPPSMQTRSQSIVPTDINSP